MITLVILVMTTFCSFAQSEAEMKQNADGLFLKKQFVEATPLYLRLLSLQPRDYEYSFKYGACLLFNSNNKQDAIRYLSYAAKSPTPINDAHFYLAKAYHLNYQFNEAIASYKLYSSKAGIKGEYYSEAQRNISMCENGKNLLTNITDVIVRKKTEIKLSDFFRVYDLAEIGGSIITAVDFQTKNDKKFNHKPIVHLSPTMENVFFSSYGTEEQLDIYIARRLPGGKFGTPQKLPGAVNTPFDEDYPYLHPNGRDLYFSSKGHNSMGGYDIFKAKINPDNNQFEDVSNVDFSISSPDDDLLYIVDKDNKNAYFSSKRQSQDGKVVVYKVGVERIPIQLAIIKGAFTSTILTTQPKMTVVVVDKTNGKKIGTFKNLQDESYLITFPKGGKYTYNIKIEGNQKEFTADVEIPFLKEVRPLKQRMIHEVINEKEIVRVVNLFDEPVDDPQAIIAQVLKERANLTVNEDLYSEEDADKERQLNTLFVEIGVGNRSTQEVAQMLDQTSKLLVDAKDSKSLLEQKGNAIAQKLYEEIATIDNEIKDLVKEADASESSRRKELVLSNAKELFQERSQKLVQIEKTLEEAQTNQATNNIVPAAKIVEFERVSQQFKQLQETGNTTEIVALLQSNKSLLKEVISSNSPVSLSGEMLKNQENFDKELSKLSEIEKGYTEEKLRLSNEISTLSTQLENAKEKMKPEIEDKINSKKYDLVTIESSIDKIQTTIQDVQSQRAENNTRLNLVNAIETHQGALVSKEELEKTKATIAENRAQTLKSYVDAQLLELQQANTIAENENSVEKSMERYNTQSEEIYSNSELSTYEKQAELLALNKANQQALEERIAALQQENELSEIPTIQKQIKALQLDQELFKQAQRAAAKEEIAKLNIENIIETIDPSYQENSVAIDKNIELTVAQKNEQLNNLDQALSTKIDQEIVTVRQEPFNENTLKEAKIALLEDEKAKLSQAIVSRNQEIQNFDKELAEQQKSIELEMRLNRINNDVNAAYSQTLAQLSTLTNSPEKIALLEKEQVQLNQKTLEVKQLKKENPSLDTETTLAELEEKKAEFSMLMEQEKSNLLAQEKTQNTEESIANNTQEPAIEQETKTEEVKPSKTATAIVKEMRALYSGKLQNDLENTPASKGETENLVTKLSNYKTALQEQDLSSNSNTEERELYATTISNEIQQVNLRLQELAQIQRDFQEQEELAKQNQQEVERIQETNVVTPEPQETTKVLKTPVIIIEELQALYFGDIQHDMQTSPSTKQQAEELTSKLSNYKELLQTREKNLDTHQNEEEKALYATSIRSEINTVDNRIAALTQIQNDFIQQEKAAEEQLLASNENETQLIENKLPVEKVELVEEATISQEQELRNRLQEEDLSKKERKYIQEQLNFLNETSTLAVNEEKLAESKQLENVLQQFTISDHAQTAISAKEAEVQNEKNTFKKAFLLEELIDLQTESLELAQRENTAREDQVILSQNKEARIYSLEELQQKRRIAIIEIDELTQLKMEEEYQLSKVKKKEKAHKQAEIQRINEQLALNRAELKLIDQQLANHHDFIPVLALEKNPAVLSYNEERQIASSESYEAYAKVMAEKEVLVQEHLKLTEELQIRQERLQQNRNLAAGPEKEQNQQKIVQEIEDYSMQLSKLEQKIQSVDQQIATLSPTDVSERMKFENLVARGINPIKKSLLATAIIPISVNGIAYNPSKSEIPALNKIPLELKAPQGLVYRVQVGAFAKAIPEDLFKEFTPVSGEKIENTNITRYMAGYFNSANVVVDAREKIRQLGYSDAFIVAYCDGKRISFGEARQMEMNKTCLTQEAEVIQLEVASNIAKHVGIEDTSKTLKEVPEYTYNQAPGAAKATAIEQFDPNQLIFTVQIGVFNRPVTNERLFNLEPLYTIRMENGQIRYSVGMYGSIEKVLEEQGKIRPKISDAFAVAYYQGKRISIGKARELMAQGVPSYSESKPPVIKVEETIAVKDLVTEIPVFSESKESAPKTIEKYYQFVSKKSFSTYPKEELKRYNAKGSFYYDKNDQYIKSTFYSNKQQLPRIIGFLEEMDTLHFSLKDVQQLNENSSVIKLVSNRLPGDLNDWLLKLPYRKTYILKENGIEILIFDIQKEDLPEIAAKAELLNVSFIPSKPQLIEERNE